MGYQKQLFFFYFFDNIITMDSHISYPCLAFIVEKFSKTLRITISIIFRFNIFGIKDKLKNCFTIQCDFHAKETFIFYCYSCIKKMAVCVDPDHDIPLYFGDKIYHMGSSF